MKKTFRTRILSTLISASMLLTACAGAAGPSGGGETTGAGADEQSAASDGQTISQNDAAGEPGETGELMNAENDLKWWQKTIAYEIYVKSFKDSDGDGIGDLGGIIEELDHLKSLGVGAVWLTPIYRSPQADNGYDIADYYQIDEMYGTMEDMDRLLEEAKKRDIRIIMDLVFNHTSNENEWFVKSRADKDNEKSDWYVWRDAAEDGGPPTNWRSIFGGSAWSWCEERGQYYLHTFLEEQPDLNWENPQVREALFDVANFWVNKGVGGFRMDAVTYIKKPAEFKDGTPDAADGMVGIHGITANTEGILDYLHEFKDKVQAGTDIFTVGEANGVAASELSRWVGPEGVFDMIFEFSHLNIDLPDEINWAETHEWKLTELKKCLSDTQASTKDGGWCPVFFENHDQGRSINHFTPDSKDPVMSGKALGTILLTLRGTPFIYQGEELGFTNVQWPSIEDYNDISTINHYNFLKEEGYSEEECMEAVHRFGRDNARTPMQWNAKPNAGFTTGIPWLPVSIDFQKKNAEAEAADESSVLSWYRRLARLRQQNSELMSGGYEELLADDEQIYAYVRDNGENRSIILVNLSSEEASYDTSLLGDAALVLSSVGEQNEEGKLKPWEAVIFRETRQGN